MGADVIAVATTTVSVLRGTTTDPYGDVMDSDTPIVTGLPISIIEQRRKVFTADNPDPRTVRYITGRVGSGTDIRVNDRLKDERTGYVYAVDEIGDPMNPVIATDIQLDLKRTS